MERLTGAQILVQTLVDQGVDTIFGYPGGAVLDIYDALYQASDKITHIETTHEQHACHAADGYARATGLTGVVLATSGPGATNLVTGIATAYLDSIPLVAITGNVSNAAIGTDAFQEVDITGITLPITKHNYFVREVEKLQDIVREAFELASSGRPGPVLIDIPKDVQVATCDFESKEPQLPARPKMPSQELLQAAADAINESKRPYIYVGGGVVASGAGDLAVELGEKIASPIGCSLMGLSAVPTNHTLFLGMQGMHGHLASTKAMDGCDCLIALGARFNDRVTGNIAKFKPNKKIVRIDVDSSELSKTVYGRVDIVGDVRTVLQELLPLLRNNTHEEWRRAVREMRAQEKGHADYREGLTPKNVMLAINRVREPEMPVATDVGQHQMWAIQHFHFFYPGQLLTSGGFGSMGFGLGAAIGAQVGSGTRSFLVTSEGSFGMNLAECITAVENQLPVTIVLLNNNVLGMVRQWQTLFYGHRYSQTTLDRGPDFVKLADAYGIKGTRVTELEAFRQAFTRAVEEKKPCLIECVLDIDEMVAPMVAPGSPIDSFCLN